MAKQSFRKIGTAIIMMLVTMSFVSCGDDDDEKETSVKKDKVGDIISSKDLAGKYYRYLSKEEWVENGKTEKDVESYDETDLIDARRAEVIEIGNKHKFIYYMYSEGDGEWEELDYDIFELYDLHINKEYILSSEPTYEYEDREDIPASELSKWEEMEDGGMQKATGGKFEVILKITGTESFELAEVESDAKGNRIEYSADCYKKLGK